MTKEFFRRLAQRCRDLIGRVRSEDTRVQLRVWAEEFEAQAKTARRHERGPNRHNAC